MAASLKVDVSIMPDFPTPPPHSDSSTASSSSATSPSSSSDKARSTVAESTPPPSSSSSSTCPFGPDYDQHGHKIKRPMNAFMVWAQMRRAEITAVSSKVHNSTISKALGVEWREMDEAAKQPYVQKAKELRDELFREHPHYVYRPRKRKSGAGARPSPYSPPSDRASPPTAATAARQTPALPSHPLLMAPSVSASPQPLAALLMQQQQEQLLQQAATTTPQMSMLFAPGQLLQQLQLAAVMQQQQQQEPDPAAALINPLLLANLLNPLFAQVLTQWATTPTTPQ